MRVALGRRLLPALLLGGCAVPRPPGCAAAAAGGETAWLIDRGWHTEVGLPAAALPGGPLGVFVAMTPGVQSLLFGFGKRDFVLAMRGAPLEWLFGPLPGAGVVQVTALRTLPESGFLGPATAIPLPPGGVARIAEFIAADIVGAAAGQPQPAGTLQGSRFYESTRRYTLDGNCNTWAAAALAAGGAAVRAEGVLLASDLLRQTAGLRGACLA